MSAHSLLTIANAAKVSGISAATLRRLDDRLKPARSEGGFRLYEFDALMDYVAKRKRGSRRRPWIDHVFCQSSASMPQIPDESVDLIVTSPPFAGRRGGVDPNRYVEWFSPFAAECRRVMKRRAHFVVVIKEGTIAGVRHQYVHDLVRDLTSDAFDWLDEYVWSKPCPPPKMPRGSLKDGWERCHLFGIKGVRDRMFFPDQVRRPLKPHHNTAPRARTTAGGFTFAAESSTDLPYTSPLRPVKAHEEDTEVEGIDIAITVLVECLATLPRRLRIAGRIVRTAETEQSPPSPHRHRCRRLRCARRAARSRRSPSSSRAGASGTHPMPWGKQISTPSPSRDGEV